MLKAGQCPYDSIELRIASAGLANWSLLEKSFFLYPERFFLGDWLIKCELGLLSLSPISEVNPWVWSYSYKTLVDYIDAQFEAYLQEELKVKRSLHNYHDTRIHACLYMIAPTGHSWVAYQPSPVIQGWKWPKSDYIIMIPGWSPLIWSLWRSWTAKSTSFRSSPSQIPLPRASCKSSKSRFASPSEHSASSVCNFDGVWFLQIMSELMSNGVQIYQFPTDDETVAELNSSMNVSLVSCSSVNLLLTVALLLQNQLPFAVVGSMDEIKVGNKMVKARQYPWGTVQGRGWNGFKLQLNPPLQYNPPGCCNPLMRKTVLITAVKH